MLKNQQLEAQIARIQLEKAEFDSKLSQQNEQIDYLRAHYESNRIRDLSLLQANQSLHHVDKQAYGIQRGETQRVPMSRRRLYGNQKVCSLRLSYETKPRGNLLAKPKIQAFRR